jgi:hypothetical protein
MKLMELQKQVLLSYSMVSLDRHYKTEDLLAHVPLFIIAKCI